MEEDPEFILHIEFQTSHDPKVDQACLYTDKLDSDKIEELEEKYDEIIAEGLKLKPATSERTRKEG